MNCQFFLPCPALRSYVEQYILLTPSLDLTEPERIPPGGKSGLTLNLGADYRVKLLGISQKIPPVAVGGQLTQLMELTKPGSGQLLQIIFTPTGLHQLLDLPILELTNQLISINEVVAPAFVQKWFSVVNQLEEIDQVQDQIRLIDNYLLTYLYRALRDNTWVDAAISWLAQPGERQIQHLTVKLRVSPRQLTREFSRQVGFSPKSYAQLMRFQRVFKAAFSPQSSS